MKFYKFRPYSIISQKALSYDELYFSSTQELNDPTDMISKFSFPKGKEAVWLNIVETLAGPHPSLAAVAKYLDHICPITYDDFLNRQDEISTTIQIILLQSSINPLLMDIAKNLPFLIFKMLDTYRPNAAYCVSLSTSSDNFLMWSHYAASHQGFCLIFKSRDGYIYQCPQRTRTQVEIGNTRMNVPSEFRVQKVHYRKNLEEVDAFYRLTMDITKLEEIDDQKKAEYYKKIEKYFLTKSTCWKYEKEFRLVLQGPTKSTYGESDIHPVNRTFHYDPTQLIGIVFGARMNDTDKKTIQTIVNHKRKEIYRNACQENREIKILPFLFKQASLCSETRNVVLDNIGIQGSDSIVEPKKKEFGKLFDEWENDIGLVIRNGSGRRQKIK